MSVVNQMLRELDRRNSAAAGGGLAQYIKPVEHRAPLPRSAVLLAGLAVVLAAAAGAMWWLQGRAPQHAAPSGASQPASPAAPAQPRTPEPGTAADAAGPAAASAGRAGSEARATVPPDVDTGDAPSSAMVAPAALDRALHANPVDATASDTGGPPASAPSVVRAERADLRQPGPVAAPVGKAEAPEVAEAAPVTHGQTVAGAIPQAQRHTRVATPVAAATTRVAHAAAAQPPASHGPVKRRSTAASTPAPAAEAAPSGDRVDTPPATPQAEPRIEKQMIESTPRAAEIAFRGAVSLVQRGRLDEAIAGLRSALELAPDHARARQTLVALLVERRALAEAQAVLEEGLRLDPAQTGFASLLARLHLDRGDSGRALSVLQAHAAYASANAEYRAFTAALLQRAGRNAEAADEFRSALVINPAVGVWWMGLGMSEQALGHRDAALAAYRQARSMAGLSPDLVAFVDRRLRLLQ